MTAGHSSTAVRSDFSADRRWQILDAAERCFVRSGFHRTTMQDVAAEAGMSPGNIYRYFRSKDALVAGIIERDRAEMARDFGALKVTGDFMPLFEQLGRKHFVEEPAEKAILCLQIWAEAARNRDIAAMAVEFESDVTDRLTSLLDQAKDSGNVPPEVDSRAAATVIAVLADGLFIRRAILPDFDAEREVAFVMCVIGAIVRGRVPLTAAGSQAEQQSC